MHPNPALRNPLMARFTTSYPSPFKPVIAVDGKLMQVNHANLPVILYPLINILVNTLRNVTIIYHSKYTILNS